MRMWTKAGFQCALVCLVALFFAPRSFSQESKSEPDAPSARQPAEPPPSNGEKEPPKRIRVSAAVLEKQVVKKVPPKYPDEARSAHAEGSVVLKVLVSTAGEVTEIKSISGDQQFGPAAMDAVKQWKYKPYFLDGEPVEVESQVTINFRMAR